jgi:hypothetical protein
VPEVVNREDIETNDESGFPDNRNRVIGSENEDLFQDVTGRQVTRRRGALNLNQTTFNEQEDISGADLELQPDNIESRRLQFAAVSLDSNSSTTIRLILVNLEDSSFNTVIRQRELDNESDFFFNPEVDIELGTNQTVRLEVDLENGGPQANATLALEDV